MFYSKDKYSIAKYIYFNSCHSTNEYVTNVLSISNPNHNYCVYTYNQTQGKGQIGRKWYTGEGLDLACTFYFSLFDILANQHFQLNMAVGLAVHDTITQYNPTEKAYIKWPNDIYIDDMKIAGILIQNQIKGKQISNATIGIGINVNSTTFPDDIPNPTSLINHTSSDKKLSQIKILMSLQKNLQSRLSQMAIGRSQAKKEYMDKLYRAYESHYFETKESTLIEGKIVGVSEEGKLRLSTQESIVEYAFREIAYRI